MRISYRLSLLLGLPIVACSDSTTPAVSPSLTLSGTVLSQSHQPVAGAIVQLAIWSQDGLLTSRSRVTLTDTLGAFQITLDSISPGSIDSLGLQTTAPGCQSAPQRLVLDGSAIPPGATPLLSVMITQASTKPTARTDPGQYCASGIHPLWGPHSYLFGLRIDSVHADTTWGKWHLRYNFSSGDDEGSFTGTTTRDALVLHLVQDVPWNPCLAMDLRVTVTATGDWGAAVAQEPQSCLTAPSAFAFAADTVPALFP